MTELKALLFDVDGTLAETEEVHREAFNEAFRRAGLDWHWDQSRYRDLLAVTGGKERIRHFIAETAPAMPEVEDLDAFIAGLHAAKTGVYTERAGSGGMPLRPGVERLLREARDAGLRLAIATTTTLENVTSLLDATLGPGARDWFELIAAGGVVPAKKPAPDIYHYTLERMQLDPAAYGEVFYTEGQDFSGAAALLDQLGEPGRPFRVLAGDVPEGELVTVPWLRALHARAARA